MSKTESRTIHRRQSSSGTCLSPIAFRYSPLFRHLNFDLCHWFQFRRDSPQALFRRIDCAAGAVLFVCVAVAPWLEPPPIARAAPAPGDSPTTSVVSPELKRELTQLFPPDHWVHRNPKILETEQCTLLIQEYQPLPDGRLELKPCTLIFRSPIRLPQAKAHRRAAADRLFWKRRRRNWRLTAR